MHMKVCWCSCVFTRSYVSSFNCGTYK